MGMLNIKDMLKRIFFLPLVILGILMIYLLVNYESTTVTATQAQAQQCPSASGTLNCHGDGYYNTAYGRAVCDRTACRCNTNSDSPDLAHCNGGFSIALSQAQYNQEAAQGQFCAARGNGRACTCEACVSVAP